MKELSIRSYPRAEEASLYAGFALNKLLEDAKTGHVLLLLSGGSAFSLLDGINMDNIGERLSVGMLDERFSTDPQINNFLQLQHTDFYKEALDKGASFFGTLPRPNEQAGQLAARYEKTLREWRYENPNGKIFATLGMGDDGHTAGMMPMPEDPELFTKLFETDKWVADYDAGNKNQYPIRVTATATMLKNIDSAIAYIAGKNKRIPFERLQNKQNSEAELPAMLFWKIKKLEIFTDLQ